MVEVIGIFGIILFGLLTIGYGASIRGKTCLWKEKLKFKEEYDSRRSKK